MNDSQPPKPGTPSSHKVGAHESAARTGSTDSAAVVLTPEEFLDRLKRALQKDGDFPASARVVSDLRALVNDPNTTANQVAEVILREPSLGVRVLHLVNSSFYRRAKPIMTVSQAVIQIGMKPLAELCSGLVLMRKFIPVARRGGAFAASLQKIVMTSLLTSSLQNAERNRDLGPGAPAKVGESGYLAGALRELGILLLAFYFPQVYEAAVKRCETKHLPLSEGIKEVVGLYPIQVSIEVIEALNLPALYKDIILASEEQRGTGAVKADIGAGMLPGQQQEIRKVARSLYAAGQISEAIASGKNRDQIDTVLGTIRDKVQFDPQVLHQVMGEISVAFSEHCASIDLPLPPLPEFLSSYARSDSQEDGAGSDATKEEDRFTQFVDEIRVAVHNGEPTASVITSVMETLAWGLKFDRVILLLVSNGKRSLVGRMAIGLESNFDPRGFERPLSSPPHPYAPDAVAFIESRPVFNGDPILADGWPLVALPIGYGQHSIGLIYADCTPQGARAREQGGVPDELSNGEQAALCVLAELLDRSVRGTAG